MNVRMDVIKSLMKANILMALSILQVGGVIVYDWLPWCFKVTGNREGMYQALISVYPVLNCL